MRSVSRHRLFVLCIFVSLAVLCGCNNKTEDITGDQVEKKDVTSGEVSSAIDVETFESAVVDGSQSAETVIHEVIYDAETVGSVFTSGEMMQIEAACKSDMNMDGELDDIFLEAEETGDGYRYSCILHMNELEYRMGNIILDAEEGIPFYLFTPDGKQLALALAARDNSFNSETYIFLYDGEEIEGLIVAGNIQRYDREQDCLFVETPVYQMQWHVAVRACRLAPDAEGFNEIIFQEGYCDYMTYDPLSGENKIFILKKDLNGYADCSLKADNVVLHEGAEIIVLGGDAKEWVLVQTVDGSSTCWLPVSSGYIVAEDSDIDVGEYFENIDIVN